MEITSFTQGGKELLPSGLVKENPNTFTLVIYQEETNNEILQKMQKVTNETQQPFHLGGCGLPPNQFELTETQLNKYFGISKDMLTQMLIKKGMPKKYINMLIN